jgi:formamidopyrimidine-DNA glycosylase
VIKFTNGYLVGHLRMTGKLFTVPKDQFGAIDQRPDLHKHLRVLLELDDFYLLFQDQRKFGYLQVCDQVDWLETKLGCEPLSGQFTPEYLSGVCQSSRQIKPLLLDQSQIAGLGNIYVDEVLWQAGVHPETRASRVTVSQLRAMYLAIPEILNRSIEAQGTTFLSYTFAGNQEGQFVNQLQIFNRAGQACLRCGGVIVKTKVAQRGTYICVICQVKG